jgi:transcription elongation factor SPT6
MKDAVMAVLLDHEGHLRTQTKFDTLRDAAEKTKFKDFVDSKKIDVVVVGGLSPQAAKLRVEVEVALREMAVQKLGEGEPERDAPEADRYKYEERLVRLGSLIPCIVVSDATARQYMDSEDAKAEFPTFPVNARYAVGLARYVQSPLNAYCKLGRDIATVSFDEHHQKLVSHTGSNTRGVGAYLQCPVEKLLVQLERGLVNAVCTAGVSLRLWRNPINGPCCRSSRV